VYFVTRNISATRFACDPGGSQAVLVFKHHRYKSRRRRENFEVCTCRYYFVTSQYPANTDSSHNSSTTTLSIGRAGHPGQVRDEPHSALLLKSFQMAKLSLFYSSPLRAMGPMARRGSSKMGIYCAMAISDDHCTIRSQSCSCY
jgi:hypothetical protein